MTPEERLVAELNANAVSQTTFHHAVELIGMGAVPQLLWPYLGEALDGRDRDELFMFYGVAIALAAQYMAKDYGGEFGLPNPELAARIRQDLNDAIDQL